MFLDVGYNTISEVKANTLRFDWSGSPSVEDTWQSVTYLTDDLALEVSLANDYRLDVPVLDDSKKYAKTREAEVDVSRDHRRFITDRSRPFYVAGMTFDSGKLCT